jgi:pimeloyl-ACP methyl ester carboxylesterase
LPGHGGTTFLEDIEQPTIESFVRSLREFFEVTNLDKSKVYLAGCSFGGKFSCTLEFCDMGLIKKISF